ncbi:MAG: CvpA family protein [bacterium]|nr:CvpA family protein [bacterium]
MTLADIIILLILLLFAISGLKRGVIWELLTTIGLIAGFGLVYIFRIEILDLIVHVTPPGWQRQWGGTLIFLLFFMIVYLGFAALGRHLHKLIESPALKAVDHGLGLAAGVLKGALLLAALVVVIEWAGAGSSGLGRFMWESKIIRWGKTQTNDLIRWESKENRQWVRWEETPCEDGPILA